jgi:lactate 2-monooxygenase
VRRAEACGCEAIVLTLDTTLLGWRPRDLDLGYLPFLRGMGIAQYLSDPVFRSRLVEPPPPSAIKPRGIDLPRTLLALLRNGKPHGLSFSQMRSAVARFVATYSRPDLAWPDVRRLRDMTKLPIVLKGILHPDDARLAREHGADAIIVSNHGGRQVDGAVATLQQLPAITAAAGDLPVLFDSGVRSGADVFKALALGARAVLLGRPYVFGLAVAGERGVREVIDNVVAEIDLTMALSGCRSRVEITAACLSTV